MVRALQILSLLLAVGLVVGESIRSWDVGRPFAAVADDFVAAGLLLLAAWLTGRPDHRARRIVVAVWALIAGAVLPNLVMKLADPAHMTPGNLSPGLLTALVGLALLVSLGGLVAAILLPVPEDRP